MVKNYDYGDGEGEFKQNKTTLQKIKIFHWNELK